MNKTLKDAGLKLANLMRMVGGAQKAVARAPLPAGQCLAHDYAGCREFEHCARCSPLEQMLRTAHRAEKQWWRMHGPAIPAAESSPGNDRSRSR
jgi:hypothetical protein